MEADKAESDEISVLKEILKWVKFAGMKEVKGVLAAELDSDQKKQVYQLSDGTKSRAEIVKLALVSAGSISGYWKKWANLGLGEKQPVMGGGDRFIRAFDLEDFGMALPLTKAVDEKISKIAPTEETKV